MQLSQSPDCMTSVATGKYRTELLSLVMLAGREGPAEGGPVATADSASHATAPIGRLRFVLVGLGISQLALGGVLALAPGAFFDALADYGVRNDHFLRDISTVYLALGLALLIAADRPAWRVPVLSLGAIQYGLHALNHLVDIGEADPGWVGPFNFVSLAAFTAVLWYAMRAASGEER
jgi:hypothetical protein